MQTDILLIRHGQTESNLNGYYMGRSNEDLNQEGFTQARKISARLAALPVVSICSSPLQRTLSTAREIARPHHLEVRILEGLTEIDVGDWQGLHISEIRRTWPELWRQWRTDPSQLTVPHGESFGQLAERVSHAFKTIVADNPDARPIIVAHEIVIKIILMQALGTPYSVYRNFEIGNTSLSWIQVRNDKTRVVTINDNSHLEINS